MCSKTYLDPLLKIYLVIENYYVFESKINTNTFKDNSQITFKYGSQSFIYIYIHSDNNMYELKMYHSELDIIANSIKHTKYVYVCT